LPSHREAHRFISVTRIFINYRRQDCPAHAGRLADALEARFGKGSVFMDVDTIAPGEDFVERIEQAIGDCDIVLALIGDDWLSVTDATGTRRIDDPDDFVRLEISSALARQGVRVIPVLVEGAQMPSSRDLPDALAALARRNAIELTDARWRSDTSLLIGAIERTLGTPPAQVPPPPEGGAPPPGARDEHASNPTRFLWILPALVGLGGITLIAFGQMVNVRRWTIAGVLYLLLLVAVVLFVTSGEGTLQTVALLAAVLGWAGSIVHLVTIRPLYLARFHRARWRAG